MKGKKKDLDQLEDAPFGGGLPRLLKTTLSELEDEFLRTKSLAEEIKNNAEERKKVIEKAGRPSGKRFRL